MKDQSVRGKEEEEELGEESPRTEFDNNHSETDNDEEESGDSLTTTMTDPQNEENQPTLLVDAQIQQAVQIAIAAIQAAQPAILTSNNGERHQSVGGLKDAPRYNGKTDVRMWLRRYEAYAHAMGWNEAEQLDTLTVALEESASEWLWSQERRDPEEEETHDKLARRKAGLVRRFGQTLISHADYTQLYALKQGVKETVDELLERLDAIERRLPDPAPEDIKKFAFISALRSQLRIEVEKQQVTTMDEATDAARRHEEILLKIYGPRKDASDMTDIQTTQPRTFGSPRQAPATAGTAPNAYPRSTFPRYGGQNNGQPITPRQPLGGGPPRFPMGGGASRPFPPPPLKAPMPELADRELEDLVNRFKAVKIGSAEHGEWQRWAMSTGRCYRCLKQGHIGRECPSRMPTQRMAAYEEDEEDDEGLICMEAEPEADPHGA